MVRRKKREPSKKLPKRRSKRVYVLVAFLVFLLGIFLYAGGVAGVMRSMAKNALLANDEKLASSWLKVAQALSPSSPEQHYLLARAARLRRDHNEMSKQLLAAYSGGYERELIDKEQCLALASIGELDPLIEGKIKKWISQNGPDRADFVDAYANGLAALSRFDDASKVLEAYEEDFPNDPMVNYRFGLMNEHIKSTEQAEDEYSQALKKDPKHAKSAWRYARLIRGRNQPDKAIEILKTIQKGPQEIAVKTFMASCYCQMGELDVGRNLFKEVVSIDRQTCLDSYLSIDESPERLLAASELGVVESNLGHFEEAKKYLEMALAENPQDFIARIAYAQVIRRLGDPVRADSELAIVSTERAEFDKITGLRDKIKQDPNDAQSKFDMGQILFKYESERFGLFWIRSALTSDPNFKAAHAFLADYYKKKSLENEAFKNKATYHEERLKKLGS